MLLKPPLPPMEARSAEEVPAGNGWQYEPKWDGFRCIAFRDDRKIYLQSKPGQPLARYFPDIVEALAGLPAQQFIIDGELVIPIRSAFLSMNCNCVYIPRRVGSKNLPKRILLCSSFSICWAKIDNHMWSDR